ncbi:MAG TPA: transferase hexapeptide repeat family protein [Burkholderiaceae bacterium]|nr:transferase hexapeptide repeat family protein [Burkholderiaceae bacterium]
MPCYAIDGIGPVVDPSAYVHPSAVLIGDVIVGPNCYVGPCASLRGDFGRIELRAGANMQDSCVAHAFPNQDVIVEENGHVGHGAVLHGCTVKRDALVGMNAVVMDDAEVGEEAAVAACAFVPAQAKLPRRALAVGSPVKVVRTLSDDEVQRKREGTAVYHGLTRRCLASLVEVQPEAQADPHRARIRLPELRRLTGSGQNRS